MTVTDACPECGTDAEPNPDGTFTCPECGHVWALETAEGLSAKVAQQFVGHEVGLFLQSDVDDFDGDGLDRDSTMDDVTTEPTNPGYERLVLKNNENPTFNVDGYDGAVDAVFFVDDDGDLLTAFPLGIPVRLDHHDDLTEVTPQIFPENEGEQ